MEAYSCSTANIIDEHKLEKPQNSLKNKIVVPPIDIDYLCFHKEEPVPLVGCFDASALEAEPQPLFWLPRRKPSLHLS